MKKKRLFSILLSLALLLGLMPGMSLTAYADDTEYQLWIGNTQVTSDTKSGKNWSYNPETNTLTLHGNIDESGEFTQEGVTFDYGIRSNIPGLTIYVQTDSAVRGSGTKTYSYGIMGGYSLTITGPGKLTAEGGSGDNAGAYGYSVGIKADQITLKDGKLDARGGL